MARMAGHGSSGGTPSPRAGAGPTVIAAALVVLVIGLGWLNHGGGAINENTTPFARDVSQAIEQAEEDGLIPASQPALPSDIGSSGGQIRQTSSTTVIIDPETGLEITINVDAPSTTGSSGTTGGTTRTTGGGGSSDTTGTTRPGSSTTDPPSTHPTTTTTEEPTTTTTEEPTTTTTTETPPTTGILEDLVGGLTGALGSVIGTVF